MKYVGVKHQPENEFAYWFSVPEDLENLVAVGKNVLCNTRLGDMAGDIVSEMDGIAEGLAVKIIGDHFPLRKIFAVTTDFPLSDIVVPWEMSSSTPEPEEIAETIREFYENGNFKVPVQVSSTGNLHDGYTQYLVAKMFGHETLRCFVFTEII